jgi:uncharacterized membrane protein YqgA involved in biofilm formation
MTLSTDDEGLDYRSISNIMTLNGKRMNHSLIRTSVIKIMEKFAISLMINNGLTGDPNELATNPKFQKLIATILHDIYFQKGL